MAARPQSTPTAWSREARSLLQPAETESAFALRYLAALQRDPAVVLAHSTMMQLLRRLEPLIAATPHRSRLDYNYGDVRI